MGKQKDFERLQRKIYLAYHQDGIIDLVVGMCVIGFSIMMATGSATFVMFSWFPIILYMPLKKAITTPRFGYIQLTSKKTSQMRYAFVSGIGLVVLLVFILFKLGTKQANISTDVRIWLQQYHMVILGALVAFPAVAVASLAGIQRFYLYALLAVVLPAIGAVLQIQTFIPVLASGFTIVAIGLWLLVHFIRQYPLTQETGADANH